MQSASVLNPIVDMYQTQLEASRQFADAVFTGTEKIDHVVIDATHRAFTEQLRFAQALAAARDPRGLASLQSSLMPRPESAVNYQKEILRVFAEIQSDIGKSIQQYVEQMGSRAISNASNATRPLEAAQEQAGDGMLNPMTSMFSVWESAFKEVAGLANKNMMAARSTFENAANVASAASGASNGGADDDAIEGRKSTSGSRRKS